ncbi:MAG TPA: hemerythrin domain-containing protein, partial [Candidatus Sulfotelmatobacter sp.]|nr:hemerythrin domain-containing protein [Candidatus Sulfotelmatobacter sp.]
VEHQQVKELLAKLEDLEPENAEFGATAKVMMEDIEHHLSEEEDELFPQVRAGMSQQQLEEIAGELESAKKVAPTHPHPKAPNTPPGNLVAGAAAAVMDRAKDAIKRD